MWRQIMLLHKKIWHGILNWQYHLKYFSLHAKMSIWFPSNVFIGVMNEKKNQLNSFRKSSIDLFKAVYKNIVTATPMSDPEI